MAKVPGLDRDGIALREVPLDIRDADAFSGKSGASPTSGCCSTCSKATRRCSCAATRSRRSGPGSTGIRAQWQAEGLTPKPYTAGTWGPSAAIALTERDGVSWHE